MTFKFPTLSSLKKIFRNPFGKSGAQIAVIHLTGPIGAVTPLKQGLTSKSCEPILTRAFEHKKYKAVALIINSPGGSPVQSKQIHDRIRYLSKKHDKPVYTFAADAAASGGYMLACAGDEIYADGSSIIGSIGVISAGFGFEKAIDKLGIERRVYAQGNNKSILDPFKSEKPEDVKRLKAIQKSVHDDFISLVKARRGDKLKSENKELFTGAFWAGSQALELGLIDGLGDVYSVCMDKFGSEVEFETIEGKQGFFKKLRGGLSSGNTPFTLPASWSDEALSTLEARSLWQRLGL